MTDESLNSAIADNWAQKADLIPSLSDSQQKVLALVPILPAFLSVVSSLMIIYLVIQSKFNSPYKRIIFGFSAIDIITSIDLAMASFLLPRETSLRVWAFGNARTCDAMGAILQLGFAATWYYGIVSFYFLMIVKYGLRLQDFRKKYEIPCHCVAIGVNVIFAAVGTGLKVFNENELGRGCWVADFECNPAETFCYAFCVGWIFGGIPYLIIF